MISFNINDKCTVQNDKIIFDVKIPDSTILKKIDDYYFWVTETNIMNITIIGLTNINGIDFLNNIKENIPNDINMHDYFKDASDKKYPFGYYDDKSKKYLHYNKNDINKIINQLYE